MADCEDLASFPPGITPLAASQKATFAYTTVKDRLPVILTKCVDEISRTLHAETLVGGSDSIANEKVTEGKAIIASLSKLVYELQRDRPLTLLEDDEEDAAIWNSVLAKMDPSGSQPATWFSAPWLFIECFMYRKIRSIFVLTRHWKDHDVFASNQKETAFSGSLTSMETLAKHLNDVKKTDLDDAGRIAVLQEFVHFSLWGNQTDLSLLQDVAHESLHQLQTTTTANLTEMEKRIIVNDSDALVDTLKVLKNGRCDFILDNAGFELYADLILADWLVHSGTASTVVFHAKRIPWFVSDTTRKDFEWTLEAIQKHARDTSDDVLDGTVQRWRGLLEKGTWRLQVSPFWTLPYPFWQLPTAGNELYTEMCTSDLWIFKGDLNYRKCLYDGDWPTTTPLKVALGGLVRKDTPPLVLLRTCKSDPAVGLKDGQAGEMDIADKDWRINGKWGEQHCSSQPYYAFSC
ncbi:hypothetical protein HKX48_000049 [Thoreauomyces humboldtii]|nr:hypothetical protein HKX48_000049 [Thoreauomyces humboldtii]